MKQNTTTLIYESPLLLLPTLAQVIGLNAALFLQQLHYWLGQSGHVYDDHTWVYNTKEQWQAQFPFWSCSTIKRIIYSLRKQGIIRTTDQYNSCSTDRKLWYTIDYQRLNEIMGDDATFPSDPDDLLEEVDLDNSADQNESSDEVNLNQPTGQDELSERVKVDRSLYGTETTHRDYSIDYPETTTTTPAQPDHACEDPAPPEELVVVALINHGLSRPLALAFAQEYPETYLQEKIAFLEYEQDRRPDLANPAGWLRRAIEQDYSPPPGYQAAQQAAVEAEEWQAIIADHNRQVEVHRQAQSEAEAAHMAEEAARMAEEAARFYPLHGTTEILIQAWEEGCKSMAEAMSLGGFLDTLEQSILLSFADGHAKIGVKCQYALQRLQRFGKHALRNALNFALEDTLQGQRASYELILV